MYPSKGKMLVLSWEIQGEIFRYLLVDELLSVYQSCLSTMALLGARDDLWRGAVEACWIPGLQLGYFMSWRNAAMHLESRELGRLNDEGVKPLLRSLVRLRMLPDFGDSWATRESCELVRRVIRWRNDLDVRRRVAAFVCCKDFADAPPVSHANSEPVLANLVEVKEEEEEEEEDRVQDSNLMSILQEFDLSFATNPEDALRALLLEFPFLPIDAGQGADRVIKALAKLYLESHPDQFIRIREDMSRRESHHNDAISYVYVLLYAIIMLNTDLHHPNIRHKMTMEDFVTSVKRTVVIDVLSEDELRRMYRRISRTPLRICNVRELVKRGGLLNLNVPAHVLKRHSQRERQRVLHLCVNHVGWSVEALKSLAAASPILETCQWGIIYCIEIILRFLAICGGIIPFCNMTVMSGW